MSCGSGFLPFALLHFSLGSVPSQGVRAQRVPITAGSVYDVLVDAGWKLHAVDAKGHPEAQAWRPTTVPDVVLTDLLAVKVIRDPYHCDNGAKLPWIKLLDWGCRSLKVMSLRGAFDEATFSAFNNRNLTRGASN